MHIAVIGTHVQDCRANHIIRLREDLHVKFMLIPDESFFDGRVNERMYYPGYQALLEAMFPEHLGFFVTQEWSPTGAYVEAKDREDVNAFYGTLSHIPVLIFAVKPRSWAYSAQKRYEADCQVRERLKEVVDYLREVFPDSLPTHVYAVSALGLQVRFYYVKVAGNDSADIHPPPGPRYSSTLCYSDKQYDYWRLSILDSLSVRTLKGIRDKVHKFAEEIRSRKVPGPEEEKLRAMQKYQEYSTKHKAAMKEGNPLLHFKVLHTSDRVTSATSRSTSPLSSLHTTVEDSPQGAIPGQASTVARATVEDNVFLGKNLVDRDFKRLRLPVPEGRVPRNVDLYTLLGDMDMEDGEWDPNGESEEDSGEESEEDDDEYKD